MPGPSESQNFGQPSSSNPTAGEFDDDRALNGQHSPKAQKDGPNRPAGHYCRLPNGHMEWVPNPHYSRGAEYHADVEMTTPLPERSTTHAAKESFSSTSSSRRSKLKSMMAKMFRERMQSALRDDEKNRTLRRRNKEAAPPPRIYSDDPTQANSPSLPDYSMESSTLASCSAERQRNYNNNNNQIVSGAGAGISSVLTGISPNPRLVQHMPIPNIPLLHYQKRPYRVSKNTSGPRRHPRIKAVLPQMGKVLEEVENNHT